MNVTEGRDLGGRRSLPSLTTAQPSGALMSALTTEHYTLQSARSSTITEANGRSSLFLSAVSGATVALALVAQLDKLGDTFRVFTSDDLKTVRGKRRDATTGAWGPTTIVFSDKHLECGDVDGCAGTHAPARWRSANRRQVRVRSRRPKPRHRSRRSSPATRG